MKLYKASTLKTSLDAGQKARLCSLQKSLARDAEWNSFDPRVQAVVRKYVWDEAKFDSEIEYLNTLKDINGYVFSRSLREAGKLAEGMGAFKTSNHTTFRWNANYQKSLELVRSKFNRCHLRKLHYRNISDIVDALPKLNTHSGFSYILTGLKKKGEYREELMSIYCEAVTACREHGTLSRPIYPATRTQCSGEYDSATGARTFTCKHKTRLVAVYDLPSVLIELQYAKPIQNLMASFPEYAGGKHPGRVAQCINASREKYSSSPWLSIDYSGYDASLSDWIIEDAFSIIKSAFSEVDDDVWNTIVHDFIHKEFISSDGFVASDKGVPSGSMFTQIIDTVCNWIIVNTYLFSTSNQASMIVMGDDNLIYAKNEIDIKLLSTYVSKNFGVVVNPDKSKVGSRFDPPSFLSREWRPGGQWRHPNELISHLMWPERFRPYDKTDLEPEFIICGYIHEYRLGMRELMNVHQFEVDFERTHKTSVDIVGTRYLPGALVYALEYTM